MEQKTRVLSPWCCYRLLIVVMLLSPFLGKAQRNLEILLEVAEKNYPAIKAKQAEAEATKVGTLLEKNTRLPSLDIAYQANYATYNNITGMNLPGQLIPISGPPSSGNFGAVLGSAASLLVKWTPITFGQYQASVDYSQKLYEKNLVAIENEVLNVKFRVAHAYLDIATTRALIEIYKKNIKRNEFNVLQAGVLVEAGLRPGIDSLKFKGELSKAKTELYQLQHFLETQQQQLKKMLVSEDLSEIMVDTVFFEYLPNEAYGMYTSDSLANPMLKIAWINWQAEQARLRQINLAWAPRLEFWGTTYARASGVNFDGTVNPLDGFSFSRYNYGVGFQLVFPILNVTNVKLKSSQQEAIAQSAQAYLNLAEVTLNHDAQSALHHVNTSLQIAREVPVEYHAAEAAFHALQVRYNEGLINYTDLIQAQYHLLQAEAKLKSAYATTWKALLNLAIVRGNLNIFLDQIQH